jgi:hypothetical protein
MQKRVLIALLFTVTPASAATITSTEAASHLGQYVTVEGTATEV